jgi:hypothetical protein
MSTVDKMMRRYLESARDFERAGFEATDDRDKFPLWERAALAGMCAHLLKSLADGYDPECVAEELESADMDGQWLSIWVSEQLAALPAVSPEVAEGEKEGR